MILIGSLFTSCLLENSTVNSTESQTATLRIEVSRPAVSDTSSADTGSSSSASVSTNVVKQGAAIRSTVALRSFSEDNVGDLHVMVYNSEGSLMGHAYSAGSAVSVTTRSGEDCSVYALTNTDDEDLTLPTLKTALLEMTTESLTTMDGVKVNDNLIMSGSLTTDITAGDNMLGTFAVSRLAARNILHITCAEGLVLTSYAIRNLPVKSWYVARPNTAETDEAVGDDAVDPNLSSDWLDTGTLSATDIATGSSTYALTFYQYENRRGGRKSINGTTGDATSQTQKATYAPDRATYVELNVNASGTSATYKLYLGANAYTNYSVKRNGSYTYDISIEASGMSISGVSIKAWTVISGGSTIEM